MAMGARIFFAKAETRYLGLTSASLSHILIVQCSFTVSLLLFAYHELLALNYPELATSLHHG
jgi:hypothetical protein